jgi:hypothetical protein
VTTAEVPANRRGGSTTVKGGLTAVEVPVKLRGGLASWLIAWMSTEVLSGLRVGCAKVTVADCCIYDDLRSFFGMALKSCPKVCMY